MIVPILCVSRHPCHVRIATILVLDPIGRLIEMAFGTVPAGPGRHQLATSLSFAGNSRISTEKKKVDDAGYACSLPAGGSVAPAGCRRVCSNDDDDDEEIWEQTRLYEVGDEKSDRHETSNSEKKEESRANGVTERSREPTPAGEGMLRGPQAFGVI